MGRRARERAERDYLWENTLPRLVQRYADLARGRVHASSREPDEVAEAT